MACMPPQKARHPGSVDMLSFKDLVQQGHHAKPQGFLLGNCFSVVFSLFLGFQGTHAPFPSIKKFCFYKDLSFPISPQALKTTFNSLISLKSPIPSFFCYWFKQNYGLIKVFLGLLLREVSTLGENSLSYCESSMR